MGIDALDTRAVSAARTIALRSTSLFVAPQKRDDFRNHLNIDELGIDAAVAYGLGHLLANDAVVG